MICSRTLRPAVALASALVAAPTLLADEPAPAPVTVTLALEPTRLDPAGSKVHNTMYFPSGAKLSEEKPGWVKKEPVYRAKPRYATVTLGNGAPNQFAIAFDEPKDSDAMVYADLNGDGDLTNDGGGAWAEKKETEDSGPQYSATFVFDVRWKVGANGAPSTGKYGLNFYRSPDREQVHYYRAGSRTGTIDLAGKSYEVALWENDNDGVFNKLYDPKAGGEVKTKTVALSLDGNQVDIRGTFAFGDWNYLATVPDDGSTLTMRPTARVIRLPRPGAKPMAGGDGKMMALPIAGAGGDAGGDERPSLLQPGVMAPDFTVVAWQPDLPAGQAAPTIKLSDYRGKKVVVVDFWATWCGPCMRGLPHVNKIAEAVKGQDVAVLAVNTWEEQPAFERFATSKKGKAMTLSLVRDPAGRNEDNAASIAKRLYNVSGIPATFVIGKDGKIAASISGYQGESDHRLADALKSQGIKID